MIEFGKSLREAREARNLTARQIADMTRMTTNLVNDLENEDFSRIPAPIYGRGFVRLYCEAVGLDPKPFTDEFMAILNGSREPTIKERPVSIVADAAEVKAPEPIPEPPPAQSPVEKPLVMDSLFDPRPAPAPAPSPAPAPAASVPAPTAAEPPLPAADKPLSRYAPPNIDYPSPTQSSYWRLGVLCAVAAALLIILFCGIRALYRATSTPGAESEPETAAPVTAVPTTPAKPRTPQKIPSLYID